MTDVSDSDKVDEKLHRRSTVRMGIRVVQRAFAPPAPEMYDPGSTGRKRRDKSKQNRKSLLFGCRSAPLEDHFKKNEQAISRSAETVMHRKVFADVDRMESATEPSWSPEASKKEIMLIDESLLSKGSFSLPVRASPNFQGQLGGNRRQSCSPVDENRCGVQVSFTPHSNGVGSGSEDGEGDQGVDLEEPQGKVGDDGISGREDEDLDNETRIGQYYRNLCGSQRPSLAAYLAGVPAPKAFAEKFYLLSDGQVRLTALLDKAIYSHGEDINVTVQIQNNSNKTVKRIKFHNPDDRNVFAIYVSYYVKVKLVVSMMGGEVNLKLPFTLMHTCSDTDQTETLMKVIRPSMQLKLKSTAPMQCPDPVKPEKDGT
nr:uncharacterized protein LOC111512985 [Leptinotarsa decemlineata]